MAATNYYCNVGQGYNFYPDSQDVVGHLTKMKVAGKELKADMAVTNPEDIKGDNVKVVGVMSGINWEGGMADAVNIGCQVSVTNKQDLTLLQHSELSDTTVEFQFIVYEYDPNKKKFFQSFHSKETTMKGLIQKSGSNLSLDVAMDQSTEVVNPINFAFNIGIMPEDEAQQIHLAASVDGKFVKAWGVAVG